jgi:hypothetical protein
VRHYARGGLGWQGKIDRSSVWQVILVRHTWPSPGTPERHHGRRPCAATVDVHAIALKTEVDMPEPVWVAIAAALAGKTVGGLYDLVRKKFADRPKATEALAAAYGTAQESPEVHALSEELAKAAHADAEFATELRTAWDAWSIEQHADRGAVVNQMSGKVSGKAVQARDITGGISF